MNWYAIYTKPRAEDAVAQLLMKANIPTLNPKIRVKKWIRKKYAEGIEQLFPCYLFALLDWEQHGHMLTYTRGVRYVVGREVPLVVHPDIITSIRERMEGDIVKPFMEDLRYGDRVRITEGPFKDFIGVFDRNMSGRERSVILLEAIHCMLDIDRSSLRKT